MASQMKKQESSQHLEEPLCRRFLLITIPSAHCTIEFAANLVLHIPKVQGKTSHLSFKIAITYVPISLTPNFALTLFPFSRLPSSNKKRCPFSVPAFLHRSAIDTIMRLCPRPVPQPSRPLMGQTCSCPAPTHPVFDTWLSMREWRQFPLSERRWSSDGA